MTKNPIDNVHYEQKIKGISFFFFKKKKDCQLTFYLLKSRDGTFYQKSLTINLSLDLDSCDHGVSIHHGRMRPVYLERQ